MAWVIDRIRDLLFGFLNTLGLLNKEATIIIIGLDNAGKSTLLHRMSKGAFGTFAPTEKPANDEFNVGGVTFKAWDLGGHEAVRQIWDDFLPSCDGVLFLIDAADTDRLAEAEEEISALVLDNALWDVPIAVLYNKEDLPFAMATPELEVALKWPELVQREGPIAGFRCSVLNGTGYTEAIQWIARFC